MVTLKSPSADLVPSYLEFMNEMKALGEQLWPPYFPRAGESHQEFADRKNRSQTQPEPGMVPETSYWAVLGGEVVGRIVLRHVLNEQLKQYGGHIGYETRPSARRKGIAKAMLKQILETPKCREIGRLLLTCAPTNLASIKTIVGNGGRLEKTAFVEKIQRDTNYYWIELNP